MRPNASLSPACAFSTRAQTSAAASSGAGRAGQTVCRSGWVGAGAPVAGVAPGGTFWTPGPGVGVVDTGGGGGTDLISTVSSRADGIVGRSATDGRRGRSER